MLERLRSNYRQTLLFAAIGTATERLTQAPQWLYRLQQEGADSFLATFMRETLACALAALVVALALRLCTDKGSDLIGRPAKFFAMVTLGTGAATLLAPAFYLLLSNGRIDGLGDRPDQLFYFWLQSLLWGGLIGWLYLLSLQRSEDHARFLALLARQALLASQLARSRLGAARAQVDPAMVAGVLSEVHRRYRDDRASAAALLDQLIACLRLAMQRGQSAPALAAALAELHTMTITGENDYVVTQVRH